MNSPEHLLFLSGVEILILKFYYKKKESEKYKHRFAFNSFGF